MKSESENTIIENARIDRVTLTTESHGVLTAWVYLDFGGSGQGFGGWCLQVSKESRYWKREGIAGYYIMRLLEIAEVDEWAKLAGAPVRIQRKHEFGRIVAIGHFLKDDWFCPAEDFKDLAE